MLEPEEELHAQRSMMAEHAEDGYDLPVTADQIRFLTDLLTMSHAATWQAFGTLTRGTASLLIGSILDGRSIDRALQKEEAA